MVTFRNAYLFFRLFVIIDLPLQPDMKSYLRLNIAQTLTNLLSVTVWKRDDGW
jgi:hypothetical protein